MKLARRELALITLGFVFLAVAAFYLLAVAPALSRQQALAALIEEKAGDIRRMEALQQEWSDFQRKRAEAEQVLERRGQGFTLLTYMERISREVGVADRIQYIKPVNFPEAEGPMQPTGIELRYERLDIKELVNFLYRVEQSRNLLRVDRIKIQPSVEAGRRSLEVTLQVNTYVLASP